jgi:peptidoglycan-associated lipoprotein
MILKNTAIAFVALFMLSGCNTTPRPEIMTPAMEESYVADFEKNIGDRVWFGYNKSDLSPEAKEQLSKQAEWLKKHDLMKATIEGHCDERGTREYNLALGERRAESVQKFLLNQGIVSNRLDTISYGKERPAVMGNDESAWKQNRRAVLVVK